jgi:hypothetical protein
MLALGNKKAKENKNYFPTSLIPHLKPFSWRLLQKLARKFQSQHSIFFYYFLFQISSKIQKFLG